MKRQDYPVSSSFSHLVALAAVRARPGRLPRRTLLDCACSPPTRSPCCRAHSPRRLLDWSPRAAPPRMPHSRAARSPPPPCRVRAAAPARPTAALHACSSPPAAATRAAPPRRVRARPDRLPRHVRARPGQLPHHAACSPPPRMPAAAPALPAAARMLTPADCCAALLRCARPPWRVLAHPCCHVPHRPALPPRCRAACVLTLRCCCRGN
jgi:hypothetical protein